MAYLTVPRNAVRAANQRTAIKTLEDGSDGYAYRGDTASTLGRVNCMHAALCRVAVSTDHNPKYRNQDP